MTHAANTLSLVADIGGTNTRVALAEDGRLLPDTITRFRNAEHEGLESVLASYLSDHGSPGCADASVALAGPVRDGIGKMTNLDWTIDPDRVARATSAERVAILNDLQAQGHALGYIAEEKLTCLKRCDTPKDGATRLMVGIGTGFNIAPVLIETGQRIVAPAEAGHITLPTRTDEDDALSRHLEALHGFPSVEEALSGRGIAEVARFHSGRSGAPRDWTSAEVIEGAQSGDPVALRAVQHATRLFGTLVGDLALIHLCFGGVFIIGGMARALAPWLKTPAFAEAMEDKGRFGNLVRDIGVFLIEDDYAALVGQARFLSQDRTARKLLSQ
ncbi:ROK family protein [Maritimibacter dapengensis]|uniref:Glucokinase n=1 Tax=Maritimibacter dapengensis TaxID=2836868 RepID=A0ABS6T2D8_9RHOB|nr:ROK family protein [Maritimibacter dapengensis]MBV7379423.1 glucokinase [Maritimibacter dapengensis]